MILTTAGKPSSRRRVLTWGAGAALVTALPASAGTHAAPPDGGSSGKGSGNSSGSGSGSGREIVRRLRDLEQRHSARLGVYARNAATGRTVRYRANERFPLCSVFKTLAVAAVLRDLDRDGEFLARRIRYTGKDVTDSGYAPVTGKPENLAAGMTVAQLCAAAICHSDNAAGNLLLREVGGPTAITRFCRSTGDRTTRLDRWEPDLNSAEPWRTTDTTSPSAIGQTYARLVLGTALVDDDRERLTGWLLDNTTGDAKLRAGLPSDWTVADRTGGGKYGTNHDVGITWPPGGSPLVMAVLTTKPEPDASPDNPLVAETARLLAEAPA
ncbi:class A beta-lactamase [Streptomyces sp. KMM 9044]|uniref:class A beta-lactamase n=1 Tax=Streptomyces sp. KMM 9044 TaxID=2744474 RepID=UPI00215132D5|nr:class A beta-lactamase [Streptomyces sp. KMM 9044]WAX79810.1 class A beta-lactamase [Streptomyces sp. KMM 9044]